MNQEQKPSEQAQGMSSINEPPGSNTAQATGQNQPNPNQQPPSGQPPQQPHQPATSPKPGQPQQQPKPKHDEDDDNTAKRRK
jgi:hypothetical protein